MLRIAMLSRWHVHASGYANMFTETGKAEIAAVWDEDAKKGEEWAKSLGVEFIADLDTLLSRKDIDAVCCCAPTAMHGDILLKAANAGKHIFTEKALAPTVAECEKIAEAVKKNNVILTVSMPHKCWPVTQFIKRCITNGDFGNVTCVRIRNAHNGVSGNWLPDYWFDEKAACGGAMMDLGCHPMYLLSWFLGKPVKYTAAYTSVLGTPVDDNAVGVIEFENGATGVSETSFVSYSSPYIIEIHGTDGVLVSVDGDVRFKCKKTEQFQNGFIKPTLPPEAPSPLYQFVDACVNGKNAPEGFTAAEGTELTRLLEETYKANIG